MKKIILISILTLLFSVTGFCQVGIGTNTPNPASILDLTSTDKGFLAPRVLLTSLTSPAPLSSHVKGMIVYNLSDFGSSVSEGYFYNDGTKWVLINQKDVSIIRFDSTDPNNTGVQFTPDVQQSLTAIYTSSVDGSSWNYDVASNAYITFEPDPSTEWYLAGGTVDAGSTKTSSIYRTGAVGIGSDSTIEPSALLDINSTEKGFLPPRMTKQERDGILNPATGLLVFCTDCNNGDGCLVNNVGTPALPSWECFGTAKGSIVSVDCPGSAVNGTYVTSVANTASNTVSFKVTNNTFANVTNDFSNWVTLSGASVGMSVAAVPTPAQPSTIASGASVTLTYTISGTPTASGAFTALFSGKGMECSKTGNITTSRVVPDCSKAFVYDLAPIKYLKNGQAYSGGKIRIPYTAYNAGVTYLAQTINISGLTLTRTAGTFSMPTGYVEYAITGTYTGTDCSSITANIDVFDGQTCSVVIGEGKSDYVNGAYTASSNGLNNTCPASQSSMTDSSYTTGWASPNAAANQYIEITFPDMSISAVKLSGGPIACWGGNSGSVSSSSNSAGLRLEYWNSTTSTWTLVSAVTTLAQNQITTVNVPCGTVKTTKLRMRNNTAQWWGLGTFIPVGYWDSNVTAPTLNCNGATIAGMTPNLALVNGQTYTGGTITVPYTSTVASAYGVETVTKSGVTITRAAGSMINGSGTIQYTISGTYSGASYSTLSFPITLLGASCSVVLGNPVDFKTGTYSASSTGYGGTCPATQASMTDASYTSGWAAPTTTANQFIEINLGATKLVKEVIVSGGPVSCWGGNAAYVSTYANVAGLVFEYWNGSAWVQFSAVSNNLTQTSLTTYTVTTPISTTRIRVRNNTAQWWGLATFYPKTY